MEPSNPLKRGSPTSTSTLPEDNINVVVRVRPLNEKEKRRKDEHVIQFPGNGQLLVNIQINKNVSLVFMRHTLIAHSFSAKDYRKVDNQKLKNRNCFHIMLCLKVAQLKMTYYSILE